MKQDITMYPTPFKSTQAENIAPPRSPERFAGTPFGGHGLSLVQPVNPPDGTQPVPVRAAIARMAIDNFLASGRSNHSAQGATLWIIKTYCVTKKLAYRIRTHWFEGEKIGYTVELL